MKEMLLNGGYILGSGDSDRPGLTTRSESCQEPVFGRTVPLTKQEATGEGAIRERTQACA